MKEIHTFHQLFGNRVATLRLQKKLTREKLSEFVGISDRFLYDIESGRKGCSAEILWHLSTSLEVSADYLLSGESDTPQQNAELNCLLRELPPDSLPYLTKIIETFAGYALRENSKVPREGE